MNSTEIDATTPEVVAELRALRADVKLLLRAIENASRRNNGKAARDGR